MFNRVDANKSTKGASKLRRDLINAEIANLRDLLPLPSSTRQRLSQLQLMALVCVFLRKANYFQQVLKNCPSDCLNIPTPNIGFSKAMSGFIMMMTQQGKLLYISENAAEYLGHSMEDLLIHGDSVYDVVDKQDHVLVQNQLTRNNPIPNEKRLFLCRINVSKNSRRQLRFGDQKVVLIEGHFLPFVPVCNRNEYVFLASCTPVVLPETRESIVQGATNIFTTIHSMDMKYLHIDSTAESYMEYNRYELAGISWYNLLHWDSIRTAYYKHQTVIQSDQERSSTALLRLHSRSGKWFWVHCVLQVKDTSEECQHPIIVCTNQVLNDKEAEVMRSSSWLYQYTSQSKFTYGICTGNQDCNVPYNIEIQHNKEFDYPRLPCIDHNNEILSSSSFNYNVAHSGNKLLQSDDTEPVDMSITSTDIVNKVLNSRTKSCHGYSSLKNHNNTNIFKYYCTDLDKEYDYTNRRRLSVKISTSDSLEQWSSSPIWSSDNVQRVPDVTHQDLSPDITTPNTPIDTPDSQQHSERHIFNFDWVGEQNVPNVKIQTKKFHERVGESSSRNSNDNDSVGGESRDYGKSQSP